MRRSDKKYELSTFRNSGFSLAEVLGALMILAMTSSSVLLVIHRSAGAAADLAMRMRAFEVARENMEKLLASNSITEITEYGFSEKYPDIQWQTTVEAFHEPVHSKMWIRAICSAEYTDIKGELQTVELRHWILQLTKQQAKMLEDLKRSEAERLAQSGQIIEDIEAAAAYVGVDADTIRQWEAGGMRKTADGYYIADELDLYERTNGKPTLQDRLEAQQIDTGDDATQKLLDDLGIDELTEPAQDGTSETGAPADLGIDELKALELDK